MYIKKLKLTNFRNYKNLLFTLTKGINIIYGNNAQGKTNLLESIYVLGLTKSHRSFIDNSLINNESNYLSIEGIISDKKIDTKLNIYIDNKIKILKYNNKSKVFFKNNLKLSLDISYYSLENQICRATMLKSKLYERKLEEIEK